jgi:hypothetical protein
VQGKGEKMKKILLMVMAGLLLFGCASKKGRIDIVSDPLGATVYMDRVKVGVTPMTYEYNYKFSKTMRLELDGYYPYEEILNWGWVHWETAKGNVKENVEIGGRKDEKEKIWTVTIHRRLNKKPQ